MSAYVIRRSCQKQTTFKGQKFISRIEQVYLPNGRNCVYETPVHKDSALFLDNGHLKFAAPSYTAHHPISADLAITV